MKQRPPPTFVLSFVDIICSCMAGVAFLVVLFATLGKIPEDTGDSLPERLLTVDLGVADDTFEAGDEVALYVASAEHNVTATDDPVVDENKAIFPPGPSREYTFFLQAEQKERLEIGIWLRSMDPKNFANVKYLAQLTEGIPYRIYWADKPLDVLFEGTLNSTNGFRQVLALAVDQATSPAASQALPFSPGLAWAAQTLARNEEMAGKHGRLYSHQEGSSSVSLQFAPEFGWGQMHVRGNGQYTALLRVADSRLTAHNTALRRALLSLGLPAADYVAVGDRGICAVSASNKARFWLYPEWNNLAEIGRFTRAGEFYSVDLRPLIEQVKKTYTDMSKGSDQQIERAIAEAIAFGYETPANRPLLRQDPLLWLLGR